MDFIQTGAEFKVFTDIARKTGIPRYDKNTEFDTSAIPNAAQKEIRGTILGILIGYLVSQRNSEQDSSSGKAATSVLKENSDCAAG